MKHNRPPWPEIWMQFAHSISRRSVDPRSKVGAVIVTGDNTQVLSVGYNGDHKGGPNVVESVNPGESGLIHAEINALLKCDYNCLKKKIMYVTTSPCSLCAKAIVNAGISEVVYDNDYRCSKGLQILQEARVKVARYEDNY
tara:strand:+ start:17492 stop:17914 length:423 start_codon:yes stop_codon:yes gene_type:complete